MWYLYFSVFRRTASVDLIKEFYKDELVNALGKLAEKINLMVRKDDCNIPEIFDITLDNKNICKSGLRLIVYDKLTVVYDNLFRVYAISKLPDSSFANNIVFTRLNSQSINCDPRCKYFNETHNVNKEDYVNYNFKELEADSLMVNNMFVTALAELFNEQKLEIIGNIRLKHYKHISTGGICIEYVKAPDFSISITFRIKQN